MGYFDGWSLIDYLTMPTWTFAPDPGRHGVVVRDQCGFLMLPQQVDDLIDGILKFVNYHGREKIQLVVEQQWDSIPDGAATYPISAMHLLYPEEYAQAVEQLAEEKTPASLPEPDHSGFVYVLSAPNHRCKIGRTQDPNSRLRQLEHASPYELEPLVLIKTDNMYALEKRLHLKYVEKRVRGEWFELDSKDIEYLKGLANG